MLEMEMSSLPVHPFSCLLTHPYLKPSMFIQQRPASSSVALGGSSAQLCLRLHPEPSLLRAAL